MNEITLPATVVYGAVAFCVLTLVAAVRALWSVVLLRVVNRDLKTDLKANAETLPQARAMLEQQSGIQTVPPPSSVPREEMDSKVAIVLNRQERDRLKALFAEYERKMADEEAARDGNRGRGTLGPSELTPREARHPASPLPPPPAKKPPR